MKTHPSVADLAAYYLLVLDRKGRLRIKEHLSTCPRCRDYLESISDASLVGVSATKRLQLSPIDNAHGGKQYVTRCYLSGLPTLLKVPEDPPAALREHPRYRLISLLGAGGMGVVYKAEHRLMHRLVALKIIHPELVQAAGMVERFHREVRAAARLSHPNIIHAYDAEQAGSTHFLVMEFVDGMDLELMVRAHERLQVETACEFARQTALGLQHACERGMVHRDIKPHNLMISATGQLKILDFGLARMASETAFHANPSVPLTASWHVLAEALAEAYTSRGAVMGTPDYIAPEEASDARKADIRADIYSLGCTLYRLLTGKVPFPGRTAEDKIRGHCEHEPIPLAAYRPDVPPEICKIVTRMMAKDPKDRFELPIHVAENLANYRPGQAVIRQPQRRAARRAPVSR